MAGSGAPPVHVGHALPVLEDAVLLRADVWRYIGEGAANIVVAYEGDVPHYRFHVLRLAKDPDLRPHRLGTYRRFAVAPSIAAQHLADMAVVALNEDFLRDLSDRIEAMRPPDRRAGGAIDLQQQHGLLFVDYSRLPSLRDPTRLIVAPVLAIEIKPKWGFLPTSPFIPPHKAIKRSVCRYCMHQRLKHAQGQIASISSYCPLDLYSRDPVRIGRALRAMLACPQNNLRVIIGGRGCEGDEAARLLAGMFGTRGIDAALDVVGDLLCRESLLTDLCTAQKSLDAYDIDGIAQLIEQWGVTADQVDAFLADERLPYASWAAAVKRAPPSLTTLEDVICAVRRFLVSTTLKDSSVFLSLAVLDNNDDDDNDYKEGDDKGAGDPIESPSLGSIAALAGERRLMHTKVKRARVSTSAGGPLTTVVYKMELADIDPKPMHRWRHWKQLDDDIVAHFTRESADAPACRP